MPNQTSLNLTSRPSGPVECLGHSFPSDEARREHYLGLLAEKLKDPEFRKIEGFPIGEDEDILALSDPPYYTACPNPWMGEFIKFYGSPYDPKEKYRREPFATDVAEGKNETLYQLPSYYTKVPPRAIRRYLEHYTRPGDVVLDAFCGSGMTGVAGRQMETKTDGRRLILLVDISPLATFTSYCMNTPFNRLFSHSSNQGAKEWVEKNISSFYRTPSGREFDYAIWSEWHICPECASSISLIDNGIDWKGKRMLDSIACPACGNQVKTRDGNRFRDSHFDKWIGSTTNLAKTTMELLSFKVGNRVQREVATNVDRTLERSIGEQEVHLAPQELGYTHMTHERNNLPDNWGITHIHHFYTRRNYVALDRISSIEDRILRLHLLFATFSFFENSGTRRNRFYVDKRRPNGSPIGPLSNTLYVPGLQVETNYAKKVLSGLDAIQKVKGSWPMGHAVISTQSATSMGVIPDSSVDFIFTDPPFGGNINYSDQSILAEWWLRVRTSVEKEAITNTAQSKGLSEYEGLMTDVFREYFRVLKPGRWIVVEFHNSSNAVWVAIQNAMQKSGFVVGSVNLLDKIQSTLHQDHKVNAVEKDLAICAYRPSAQLELRFRKASGNPEAVWEFVRSHLENVPIVKVSGGALEFIPERDPRILYDRMVAFCLVHETPVPMSFGEFNAKLAETLAEREGMVFLPDQVVVFDKRLAQSGRLEQMPVFVEDERSAIDWIRRFLRVRPSTYQEIHPEFTKQISASWKKFESRPELRELLEQNFICYSGIGDVPSQIHSYLSTQNKDLRNLNKEDSRLKQRAKDRWYVPDPGKLLDMEALRNRRLLREFWDLCTELGIDVRDASDDLRLPSNRGRRVIGANKAKRVSKLRTEAVRLGFKECFSTKKYNVILDLAALLPDNVVAEDEQLQMIRDMAEMRAEG